jgi:hypothetical protein
MGRYRFVGADSLLAAVDIGYNYQNWFRASGVFGSEA